MNVILPVLVLLLGIAAGFIVNVLSTRLAANRPLLGKFRCTRSPHELRTWQILPMLGYFLQRGKCSTCGKPLSLAYPATEVATGVLFLLIFTLDGLSLAFFFHALYVSILMLVLVLDWKHRDIYVTVMAAGWLVALAGSLLVPGVDWHSALLGAAVAGGFFLVAYLIARVVFPHIEEPLGSGDVLLALLMGLMLGFPNVVGALVIGPLIAGAVAILMLVTRRTTIRDFMPYGVSLCVAAILFLLNPGPLVDALHLPALGTLIHW